MDDGEGTKERDRCYRACGGGITHEAPRTGNIPAGSHKRSYESMISVVAVKSTVLDTRSGRGRRSWRVREKKGRWGVLGTEGYLIHGILQYKKAPVPSQPVSIHVEKGCAEKPAEDVNNRQQMIGRKSPSSFPAPGVTTGR